MDSKPVIAIDIDDVLSLNAEGFAKWSNERFGTHISVDDYQEHWAEVWKVQIEEAQRRADEFHSSNNVGGYKVVPGAKEALLKLKEKFDLILLTSRRSSIAEFTREWIDINYPGIFKDCIFCGFFDVKGIERLKLTKAELVKQVNASYFIDDQLKHVEAAASLDIPCLLFGDYAWNQKENLPQNITRVKNWAEILKYFSLD